MKKLLFALLLLLFPFNLSYAEKCVLTPSLLEYYFSPKGEITNTIVKEIANAKVEILVQAYSFTSLPIDDALIDAKTRGVNISVVVDDSTLTGKGSKVFLLYNFLIPVFVDKSHGIAHNKVIIIDKKILITGSFNFTVAAEESNAENIVIVKRNYCIVNGYIKNFESHKAHSSLYSGVIVGKVNE